MRLYYIIHIEQRFEFINKIVMEENICFVLWIVYNVYVATENQQARINGVIGVNKGVYLHKA